MNPHYTYLLINLVTIIFPLLLSFDRRVAFWRQWSCLWRGLLLTGLFFIGWDALFTCMGVWWFNDAYLLGPRLLGLPLEEWLFFLSVPYSCVFVYACLRAYFPLAGKKDRGWNLLLGSGVLLLLLALLFYEKAYTFSALGLCGLGMVAVFLLRKRLPAFRADTFFYAYLICLLPFLLVNGFLTALPVVQYNDAENLGIRIYTIPLEDVFYGLLLVLGNVAALAWCRGRKAQ